MTAERGISALINFLISKILHKYLKVFELKCVPQLLLFRPSLVCYKEILQLL